MEGGLGTDRLIGELAERQHGLVTRRQLLDRGIKGGAVEARVDRGQLRIVHRGVYAVGYRLLSVQGRWMAAVLACGPGALLSRRSAGQLWGIVPPADRWPEVTRRSACRGVHGISVHRGLVRPDERGELLGIPVTSVVRTQFDLAGVLSKRGLERAMHEAEVKRLTDRLSLPDLLTRYPRRRGAANLRALLRAKTPTGITQNDFEELFVGFLDAHGLPRPRFNATLPVRGRLLRPDCMWPEERLLAELDGRAVHGTERAFESDRQRDRILLVEGWRSTRITWRQLRDEPSAIATDLGRLLRGPGRPPTL
jgi:very-short-patch-repair endonuclease